MSKSLLIHKNNVPFLDRFTSELVFNPNSQDIDQYIFETIIPEIKEGDYKIIYIKDNLSFNYLGLQGIYLAHYIRLSNILLPIVILSDLDLITLLKLTPMSKIFLSKNIFIQKNNINKTFDISKIGEFKQDEYKSKFLDLIEVLPPKYYLSHHDVSNEWAIYRWAELLEIKDSIAINQNREKISSMLYFKYLLAKYPIPQKSNFQFRFYPPKGKGKILYIDDEWSKGWSDILKDYLSQNEKIDFNTFEYDFKDKSENKILLFIKYYCKKICPDIVILDLRLTQRDYREDINIEELSGIRVTQIIKNINPAIQIIMFTATSQSIILESLYQHGILGYIKKEHPKDININTKDNINKLKKLVEEGFKKSYLKRVWNIQNSILNLPLSNSIQFEIKSIFGILDSNMEKKYIYAMLSIHKCLEEINNLYIDDRRAIWIDTQEPIEGGTSTRNKILNVLHNRLEIYTLDNKIRELTHLRNNVIHPNNGGVNLNKKQILEWFKMLRVILKAINHE